MVSIYGVGFGEATQQAYTVPLPVSLLGVSVSFDVESKKQSYPASIIYVGLQQINVQVPWELAGETSATMKVGFGETFSTAVHGAGQHLLPGGLRTRRRGGKSDCCRAERRLPGHLDRQPGGEGPRRHPLRERDRAGAEPARYGSGEPGLAEPRLRATGAPGDDRGGTGDRPVCWPHTGLCCAISGECSCAAECRLRSSAGGPDFEWDILEAGESADTLGGDYRFRARLRRSSCHRNRVWGDLGEISVH